MTDTGRDFYGILGVNKDSDINTIRKAYKKGATKWHPDRNPNNKEESTKKFKDISDAYEVLKDDEKRKIYDKYGETGLKNNGNMNVDPSTVFENFFGGGFGGFGGFGIPKGKKNTGPHRGQDIVFQLEVELEDLYNGKTKKLKINKNKICDKCNGEGSKIKGSYSKCGGCNGNGIRIEIRKMGPGFVTQTQTTCNECRGEGKTISEKDKCELCKGKKIVPHTQILEIEILKGMKHGEQILFHGESEQYPGTIPGDIIVIVNEKNNKHPNFTRRESDLIYNKKITLVEALTGFQFELVHLDERTLIVSSQEGDVVKPGDFKIIHNEGMPIYKKPSENGRLVIQFEIIFPTIDQITEEMKIQLKQILPPPTSTIDLNNIKAVHVIATDYIESRDKSNNKQAYETDETDEHDEQHIPHGSTQCRFM